MEKLKTIWNQLSLKRCFVLCVSVFASIALVLCLLTATFCSVFRERIYASYPIVGERYYLTNEAGEQFGEGAYIGAEQRPLSKTDAHIVAFLELFPGLMAPVYSVLCIMAAAVFFYQKKLKNPLKILSEASKKISENNLDFSVVCDSQDELGELCCAFEQMRSTLEQNFQKMWRQVEERRRLNAAFAHELRTPLTVLKGYQEMLSLSEDPETKETADTIKRHLVRMEQYIDSMSRLHKIEDLEPEYQKISLFELLEDLTKSAKMLCETYGKTLYIEEKHETEQLFLDPKICVQIFDNLLSNALRYAKTTIVVSIKNTEKGLDISVSDDGPGFSKIALQKAMQPYFTEEKSHAEHFGLGLSISQTLCRRHFGWLRLENTDSGAKVSAFFGRKEIL